MGMRNASSKQTLTRVMVIPQDVQRVHKRKCAYAALKTVLSRHVWDVMVSGPARENYLRRLAEERASLDRLANNGHGKSGSSSRKLPYVGIHLRHKYV